MAMYFGDKSGRAVKFVPGAKLSAQELLDKLKTVDGEGSGLDADTLDGKQASEFVQLDENNKVPEENIPFVIGETSNRFLNNAIPSRINGKQRNMFVNAAYGNGIYLMLTRDGFSAVSKDTLNWSYSSVSIFSPDEEFGVENVNLFFFNGFFYFFGNGGAERVLGDSEQPHFIYKSSDGLTWERYQMVVSGMNGFRYNVPNFFYCCGNDRFLATISLGYAQGTAVGISSENFFGNHVIVTSNDMVNWKMVKNRTNLPYSIHHYLGGIIWDKGEYISFLADQKTIHCIVSTDGENFTLRSTVDRGNFYDSAIVPRVNDNGILLAFSMTHKNQNGPNGSECSYLFSRDKGKTIELKTLNLKSYKVALEEKDNVFYLFNSPGGTILTMGNYWPEIWKSTDGENWDKQKFPNFIGNFRVSVLKDYFFVFSGDSKVIVISKKFEPIAPNSVFLLNTQYIKLSRTQGQSVYNDSGFALQESTVANHNQLVCGKGNVLKDGTGLSSKSGTIFVVGNGNEDRTVQSNAFRVDASGDVFAAGEYASNGADYAEFFEWQDGNPNSEDRRGRVVTLDGEKIRYAADGEYILGIISGAPAVLGDTYDDQWAGMYEKDIFGSPIKEYYTEPIYDDQGVLVESIEAFKYKLNPNYNPAQRYIPRSERKEWAMVGMLGKLTAQDDGTCQVNGFAQVHQDGVFTKSAAKTQFRVMSRIDATHVRVLVR